MAVKLEAILTASDKATSVIKSAQASVIGLNNRALAGLKSLDAMNARIGASVKTAVTTLGVAGFAVGGVGAKVIGAGADFEQAITNVGAVSLMTRDQIADLEKKALELGASTKFSATEVANAMEMMGRAGFTNAETLSGVGGILAAAAAEGTGLEETASNVSNVLKGMGLETAESGRVADVLTLASARTNSSISSLGESMKNVSSTARSFGISLEDTVATVALLQDIGLDASEAGSSFNTMLTMMAAPSKSASAQMTKLGVSFKDAKGNMLPFADVLGQLKKSADKAGGNMEQVAFLADLVGLRGSKAAGNLSKLFEEGKVAKLKTELDGAAGSAEKMASIRMDTLLGDWETLGGSVDSLKISLFNMKSGPLREVVQGTREWIDANASLIASGIGDKITEWTPIVLNFADGVKDAFTDAAPIIKSVGSGIGTVLSVFGNESESARMEAYSWGHDLATAGIALVGFTVATKVASAATLTFQLITKATRLAVLAYEYGIKGLRLVVIAYETSIKTARATSLAMALAMDAGVVSNNAFSLSMIRMRLAALTAAGGVKALAVTAGAAVAAVAAVMLAVDQAMAFANENGGWEGVKGFVGIGTEGWGFEGIDEVMNRQAKAEAEKRGRDNAQPGSRLGDMGLGPVTNADDTMGGYGLSPAEDKAYRDQLGLLYSPTPAFSATPPAAIPPAVPGQVGATPAQMREALKNSTEVTIKAPEGMAEVTKKPEGAKVKVVPSGQPVDWGSYYR
ncbi:MAG TPA: phage tail tape measure protein [Polyangiaceae bacterium]|nr:phage tail tape measure protein [Polyangiaceae bacterium]